jgi:hypothetical protein
LSRWQDGHAYRITWANASCLSGVCWLPFATEGDGVSCRFCLGLNGGFPELP